MATLQITRGGPYTGTFVSPNPDTPAVTISTTEPVVLVNCTFLGPADCVVNDVNGIQLTVRGCRGFGQNPGRANATPGRFLNLSGVSGLSVSGCYMKGTGGMQVADWIGGGRLQVIGNYALDVDGRRSDGGDWLDYNQRTNRAAGVVDIGYEPRSFLGLTDCRDLQDSGISWNKVVNTPGNSRVENNIHILRSSGSVVSSLVICDNFIQGAYTIQPGQQSYSDSQYDYDWAYTGGGILVDGTAGDNAANTSSFVRVYQNVLISTTWYAIAIYGGHDNICEHNRMVSSGGLFDGTVLWNQNGAVAILDAYRQGAGVFFNNVARNNVAGWLRPVATITNTRSTTNRSGEYYPVTLSQNNVSLPDPITLATEVAELIAWTKAALAAGVKLPVP